MNKLLLGTLLSSFAVMAQPNTVDKVDLERYLGKWFEIAHVPNKFQDNTSNKLGPCKDTVAEYSQDKNHILVTNTCRRLSSDGSEKIEVAHAIARVVEGSGNAKLKVNFTGIALLRWLGIGDGDYWVLALGPVSKRDGLYSWALVGGHDTKYGWILARDAQLGKPEMEHILGLAEKLGYLRTQFIFK